VTNEASTFEAKGSEPPTWEERMTRLEVERLEAQDNDRFNLHERHKSDDTTLWLVARIIFRAEPEINWRDASVMDGK